MKGIQTAVALILLSLFIYFGYLAGFWVVMNAWDWRTWAIFFLGCLISFLARDEFDGK